MAPTAALELAAIAVTILGLAVPVTASFIISWVIVGPALISLGVPEAAAAMFMFGVLAWLKFNSQNIS